MCKAVIFGIVLSLSVGFLLGGCSVNHGSNDYWANVSKQVGNGNKRSP